MDFFSQDFFSPVVFNVTVSVEWKVEWKFRSLHLKTLLFLQAVWGA